MITLVAALLTVLAPSCPEPPVKAPVVVPFRAPACRWCAGHRGLEYATTPGTPVAAVVGGVVTFAGTVAGTRYVVVQQTNGLRATYGQLATIAVRQMQQVTAGAVVGRSGSRLYFGWRRATPTGDVPVDPTSILGRWVTARRLVPPPGARPRPPTVARLVCPAGASSRVGR